MKKTNYMKALGLVPVFLGALVYGQASIGEAVTTPIASPSMAAMSQYSDVPISLATGLPDIGISLSDAPTSGGLKWPLGLSYNARRTDNTEELASDVGRGWSFFGAGVVYKKIVMGLDECYDNAGAIDYQKNEFDDIYYYNLPGLSGKFRIKRDIASNTFSLVNLVPNGAKIEYVRDSNTSTFKADSFTITADNGYKYFFDKPDIGRYNCDVGLIIPTIYKPAYYLTKILSPIGAEVAVFTYDEKTKYRENSTNYLIFLQNKLKAITSRNGQTVFNYSYDETLEGKKESDKTASDPYSLQKIIFKNPAGEELSSYVFNYTMVSKGNDISNKERILNSVFKNDKNNSPVEKNSFVYNEPSGLGRLKRLITPSGGVTEYNFENGEVYVNYNDPAYLASLDGAPSITNPIIQYWAQLANGLINTNQTLQYNFTIPGDTSVKKYFRFGYHIDEYEYPEPPIDPFFPDRPPKPRTDKLKITLKRDGVVVVPTRTITQTYHYLTTLNEFPGNYTLEIESVDGAVGKGSLGASEVRLNPGPFRNGRESITKRIKNIKYFKNPTDTNADRIMNYEYESFTQPNSASGFGYANERDSDDEYSTGFILYKNVKVFENGKGYTRYFFKTPDDYPKQPNGGPQNDPFYFWPYYNVTKSGLMRKKETYNEQNTLLTEEVYDYELDNYSNEELNMMFGNKTTSKPAYIKKSMITAKAFFPNNGMLESSSETWMNTSQKPYYTKSTADGETSEQFITYPSGQAGYSHLVTANMTGIPVINEEKKNGKMTSKSITRYESPSLLPTSVLATNIADGSTKQTASLDAYDDKGNILQVTSADGIPATLIYGYNKTQVIARIEGAKYNEIKNSSLITTAIAASDSDNTNPGTESALITALDNLRMDSSMTAYRITTYTYDPMVGLTTTTSPDGRREMYEYDSAGRLKTLKRAEKDASGNTVYKTLKEYKYNYKP
ncbi:RHS repeat protein [Chryseobacterium indologenes]|uniref:RHS repeat protein n=1 Tax=Chryseobacterium indologenes TaxID=253 RepID=A0A0N0ZSP8_CHRID|nr:RHS repeat protein [Chryseobacterium indologenes]KPE49008.1 hypothetical protein AOB46_22320 [Chryseobacterium indologenes]